MTPEDLQEMRRRLAQEELLYSCGFNPVLEGGRELWVRDDELYARSRAAVEALREAAPPLDRSSLALPKTMRGGHDGPR